MLTDLDAFSTEHRYCGDLNAGVDAEIVWMACTCGASMARRVDEDDRANRRLELYAGGPRLFCRAVQLT